MQQTDELLPTARVPGRKPGPAQREEVLRIWDAVDDDGRKMLLFVSRAIAVKQGLAGDDASLFSAEAVL